MAKIQLPYEVNNRLSELIKDKAREKHKGIKEIEDEIKDYCGLNQRDTIVKYKSGQIDPSLPVAMKICEYFGTSFEEIFELREV
jgi:transcriptional regulator with XRE-family HTH domain